MRGFGKALGRILAVLIGMAGLLWLLGPYEPADLEADFDPLRFGEGVEVYFETVEAQFDDITPGTEKRVIWQEGFEERRTPVSVLYVHGFSATSEEIRPVPDHIADALGANLVYTRLQGHGRPGDALGEATVAGWMNDLAEGLAAARAVGDRVVVLSTSTGGTLAAAAARDPVLADRVAAMIFVSPNFGINDPAAGLLTWPAARYWVPLAVGDRRRFEPASPEQGMFWTTDYPMTAVIVMAALVKEVMAQDMAQVTIPALFWFSPDDHIVRPDKTAEMAARWGGPVSIQTVSMGAGDDPDSHVVAGDIMSPGQTGPATTAMLAWLATVLGS